MNREITHDETKPEVRSSIVLTKHEVLTAVKNMLESEGYQIEGRIYLRPPDYTSISRCDDYTFYVNNDGTEPGIVLTGEETNEE